MKDRLWQDAYDAILPVLNDTDVVVAPRGDWWTFPCAAVLCDDLLELKDCTILVLHKGQMTNLPKAELRWVAEEWQWIFANEVFVVFSRFQRIRKDVRRGREFVHCKPLMRYLASASLRKRRSRIVYVHMPKTGGTSMWASLLQAFPSHVYYPSLRAYLSNPPAPDEYDLVGLHFSPSVLLPSLREDDWLIGMVRDPTQRLLSAVMHARREAVDPETCTPSTKAMREMHLTRYMATDLGRFEARLQLISFGTDCRRPMDLGSDQEMLRSASALSERENIILAPSERSRVFLELVAHRLAFRPGPLQRLNANEPAARAAHLREINEAIDLINSINTLEREFYGFVCQSFENLRVMARRWRPRLSAVLSPPLPSPAKFRTAAG
jgi:hypothetical protein